MKPSNPQAGGSTGQTHKCGLTVGFLTLGTASKPAPREPEGSGRV